MLLCKPYRPPTHLQLAAGQQDQVERLHHGPSKPGIVLFLHGSPPGAELDSLM